jgi:GNAT superfamily N-acetyltransferase
MSSLVVRQAVLADLDALARLFDLYRQFYKASSDVAAAKAFLAARFNHGESVLFIAEDAGQAVGFTQLYPSFSSTAMGRIFILNDLYVDASARRAGVGARLLGAATAFARAMGAVRISLNTDVQNVAAQATYEREGWERDQKFYTYNFPIKP